MAEREYYDDPFQMSQQPAPAGYHYDENGNLVQDFQSLATSNQLQPGAPGYDANTDPTVAAPPNTAAPPGMHWDPTMANWMPDAPSAPQPIYQPPPSGGAPPPSGYAQPPSGGLLAPYGGPGMPSAPGAGTGYLPPTPNFTPPSYEKPPAFNLPTYEQAANDPGYQFTLKQGLGAFQNSAAARGLAGSGGTAKGLVDYGQAAATTQYGNVLNRLLQQYLTNAQTQYNQPYEYAYRSAVDQFAPQMTAYQTQAQAGQRAQEFSYDALWNQYLQNVNNFRDQRDSTYNKVTGFYGR